VAAERNLQPLTSLGSLARTVADSFLSHLKKKKQQEGKAVWLSFQWVVPARSAQKQAGPGRGWLVGARRALAVANMELEEGKRRVRPILMFVS
jgi:hypothetical protein